MPIVIVRTCGFETAAFTKDFLDRMATPLAQGHCHDYQVINSTPGLMTRWNFWSSMTTWWNLYIFQVGSPLCEMDANPVLQDKGTALQLSVILVLFVAFIWWMEGNVRPYLKFVIFMQTHWTFQSFCFHDYATNGCVCMICRSSSNCFWRFLLELENIHFQNVTWTFPKNIFKIPIVVYLVTTHFVFPVLSNFVRSSYCY